MEPINVGILSIIPPVVAITLALIFKDVISSLIIGIITGALIYALSTNGNIITAVDYTFTSIANNFDVMMIIFLSVLGALVAVVTLAGGSSAYGNWAAKKIKSKTGAQLSTSALGLIVFIDDYFNCLTVGTVMRPVTDKYNISRVKLAYLIDATAAPICIIAPVSSWAASVISYMSDTGIDGMTTFIASIPYNLYAILTILMVFLISKYNLDFGTMAKYEKMYRENNNTEDIDAKDELTKVSASEKGRVYDLVIPILALIVFTILAMLYTGGYFKEDISIFEGFGNTNASKSLVLGGFAALIVAFLLFIPRKVIKFDTFMDGITLGVKSMVSACIILTLAWGIKGICTALSTGAYVSHLVEASHMPVALIPAIIFIVSGLLSFSIGTSWGTFGILIPIIVVVCQAVAPDLVVISLAATLAGSVFGDHCSPISDTTILSSTAARCKHIDHVTTQIPYASLVATSSFIGFIIAGFTKNVFITLITSILLLLIALKFLHNRSKKQYS